MPEQSLPVMVVLIDAFRHDFVSDDLTPNLAQLAADGTRLPLRPILGYSDAIRATVFTGHYPDETGYWMEYSYRPEASPWTGADRFSFLDRLSPEVMARGAKMATSLTVMRALARRRQVPHLDLRNMPMKAADRFGFTLNQPMTAPKALGYPSIFDACTAAGRPWAYLDASKVRRASDLLNQVSELSDDTGLIFVYLHQVDMAAHVFGISSKLFWQRVRSTDALLGQIVSRVRLRFGDVDPVIFADHGMSPLLRQINVQELLTHPAFPSRFLVALDATMIRLWFFDDGEVLRREVRDWIASHCPGRFLSPDDLAAYHLQFTGRLYGDEIYLLPPGIGIFPNYHSYIKPKAMHAYEPTDRDQWGIFIGPAEVTPLVSDPVELVDVTALILKTLNAGAHSP